MIAPLTFAHALHVALNMRDSDWAEIQATTWHVDRAEYAYSRFKAPGMAFSMNREGHPPACVGGLSDAGPGVMTAWLIGTDEFPAVGPWAWRFIMRQFIPRAMEAGVHRIQALIHDENVLAVDFAARAGLRCEGLMRSLGRNGENFWCYARVET